MVCNISSILLRQAVSDPNYVLIPLNSYFLVLIGSGPVLAGKSSSLWKAEDPHSSAVSLEEPSTNPPEPHELVALQPWSNRQQRQV